LDPSGDYIDHHEIYCPEVADPIYKPSSEFDSDGGREIFIVGQGDPPTNQIEEEIYRAAR
jgi:hypothetical protein